MGQFMSAAAFTGSGYCTEQSAALCKAVRDGVLLHVERHGAVDWHGAFRLDLSGVSAGGVLADIERVRTARSLNLHRPAQAFCFAT